MSTLVCSWTNYQALEPVVVVSRGLAGFSRGREHLAVVSRAVVTVVSRDSGDSRES